MLLAGLSFDFESVVSSASLSSAPLPFQQLVDALLECETRQSQVVQYVVTTAHYVEGSPPLVEDESARGGRSSIRGRGRNFHPRLQCQFCSRYRHLAQLCYYRYHRDEQSPVVAPQRGVVSGSFHGISQNCFPSQNYNGGQNCSLPSFVKPNFGVDTMAPRGPHAFHVPFGPNSARPSVGMHYAHNGGHFGSPSLGLCVGDGDKGHEWSCAWADWCGS